MWCKWYYKFADGGHDWEWMYLGNITPKYLDKEYTKEEVLKKYIQEEYVPMWNEKFEWSDNYRGVKFEIVEAAPRKIIEDKLRGHEKLAQYHLGLVEEFKQLLELCKSKK